MNKEEYRKYFDKERFKEISSQDFYDYEDSFQIRCIDGILYFKPIIKEPEEVFPKVFKARSGYRFEISEDLRLKVFDYEYKLMVLIGRIDYNKDLKALEDAIAELKRLKAKEKK